jgi:Cd2+/Zn2+-exporting ATPase
MAVSGATCREGDVCWHGGELSPEAGDALALAAAAEQYSAHPLATAIVAAAQTNGLTIPAAEESEVVSGLGVRAKVGNQSVIVGQPRFFNDLPAEFRDHADRMRAKGLTVAVMQVGDAPGAQFVALGLRDEPRVQSAPALKALRAAGVKTVVMLTGDTPQTARAVAADLSLDDVQAGLMPDDKLRWIESQSAEGRKVMMVGDGVNDAPSLARAHLGVAMGGLGSDVALNAADAVLMHDNLERIAQLVQLGRKARRIITANLVFAGSVVVVLTLGLMILDAVAPQLRGSLLPIAVVGHEGSTVLVILNGLRLLRGP